MSTGFLPIGTKGKITRITIKTGDILLLADGSKVIFNELKRTKWNGQTYDQLGTNRRTIVPVWRDRMQTVPFIREIVGFEPKIIKVVKTTPATKFKFGELFSIDGHKETFMYVGLTTKRGGKEIVRGIDMATKRTFNIEASMKLIKFSINDIKKLATAELTKI